MLLEKSSGGAVHSPHSRKPCWGIPKTAKENHGIGKHRCPPCGNSKRAGRANPESECPARGSEAGNQGREQSVNLWDGICLVRRASRRICRGVRRGGERLYVFDC